MIHLIASVIIQNRNQYKHHGISQRAFAKLYFYFISISFESMSSLIAINYDINEMADDFNNKVREALIECAPWKNIKIRQTMNLVYQKKQKG